MNMISMFQPTMVRNAVGPGAVHRAERPDNTRIQPLTDSLTKSMPNTVSPAKMMFQSLLRRARRTSTA